MSILTIFRVSSEPNGISVPAVGQEACQMIKEAYPKDKITFFGFSINGKIKKVPLYVNHHVKELFSGRVKPKLQKAQLKP